MYDGRGRCLLGVLRDLHSIALPPLAIEQDAPRPFKLPRKTEGNGNE